ncbi:amino acid adenylation domain-containing protein [Actinosynnema sp. NPDC023587]|uniref:amino acid adenylation domain-containing protein n=1 Tax=Actinosynnema sp. NPDC023587 TaxID=3154695 RepID=UPI0033EA8C8A
MTEFRALHTRFDAAATAAPDRIAISADDELTYREVRERSDGLARELLAAGVARGDVVGLHLDRSAEAVVAMLAVLKAGAAYLPLPVDHPDERLRHVVAESAARLVLSRTGWAGVPVLRLDEPRPAAPAVPLPSAAPADLAYVIFTSGSTGRPKGVGVTHGGATNLVAADQEYVRFGPDEVVLQLAPIAFDASAFEIWGALANGGRLVLAAPSYQALEELPRCLVERGVTTLLLTPALFHVMVDRHLGALDGVRQLVVGGDAMSAAHARRYVEHKTALGVEFLFHNVYGPTEATTLVSFHPMRDVPADAAALPLGTAIGGAALHLLGPDLRPVRPGERGEIHLGGVAVARGYVNRPGRTAERFRPDPFTAGARLYATGDEGRLRPDGLIEFTGRLDDQVKVRGHRVEPGEVEHAVLGHPAVRAACVVLSAGQLVAHVVGEVSRDDLLAHVRSSLPEYMAPGRVVAHDALPLTSSGKVDRRSLAEHALGAPAPAGARADLTPAEAVLAAVWCEVLGVAEVGPDSDFFALGGDSLLAIRVLGEAEDRGLAVPLVSLFRHPTLRGVCAGLELDDRVAAPAEEDGFALLPADDRAKVPAGVVAAMPATRLQLGMVFESMVSAEPVYLDVVSREVALPLRADALRRALDETARRHPALRTRFDLATFAEPVQLVEPDPAIPLVVGDHTGLGPAALAARHEEVMSGLAVPFDPEVAPLIRVHAARLGDDRFRLSYAFHHAVLDGWSESVLALELLRSYRAELAGGTAVFEPPAPYAEYVRLERAALADAGSREYFRRFADGVVPDGERRVPHYRKASLPVAAEHAQALDAHAGTWGIPVKSQVFAAYYAAVAALWERPAPVVGMSVNGRPEVTGADRTLGLFLNHVPVRLEPAGTWLDLARAALAAENDLLPHRRFPYAEVRALLGGPPFEVAFSYVRFHTRDDLLEEGLVTADEDVRDQTSLPVRVEVVNDGPLGITLDVTADEDRFGAGFAHRLAERLRDGIARLATAPETAPALVR